MKSMKINRLTLSADSLSPLMPLVVTQGRRVKLPLFNSRVAAGFPSPADDYVEKNLDLNEYLIQHPDATFVARAQGNSMTEAGIQDGALLIVDKSIIPRTGHIVIASINGELTCKILDVEKRMLLAANKAYAPILLNEELDTLIEGVVLHAINPLGPWR